MSQSRPADTKYIGHFNSNLLRFQVVGSNFLCEVLIAIGEISSVNTFHRQDDSRKVELGNLPQNGRGFWLVGPINIETIVSKK